MFRISLNAGHCNTPKPGLCRDPGAVGHNGLAEADVTPKVVLATLYRLEQAKANIKVYAKRQPGAGRLGVLVKWVNYSHPDLFVSVHCNAAPGRDPLPNGAQVYFPKWYLRGSRASQNLADGILSRLPNNETRWARVIPARFYVLRKVRAPVRVLVETDFISNPETERRMRSAEWVDEVSAGIADGVVAFIPRLAEVIAGGG